MKNTIQLILIILLIQNGFAQKQKETKQGVCFALYTVHENTLKMTAQFYPIKDYNPFIAELQIKNGNRWESAQESRIQYPGYTAHFRIDNWDDTPCIRPP